MIFTHAPATLFAYAATGRNMTRLDLLVLGFLSMAPDLDHFLPGTLHASRVYLHNLAALGALLLLALILSRQYLPHVLAGFGSHILIDFADKGGIAILYPLTRKAYGLGLWWSPEPSYATTRGLPLDLALSGIFIAGLVATAWYRRGKAGNAEGKL